MFDMAEFLKDNLITGFQNGSFTEQQVNIFAMNYLMKGMLEQEDFEEIMTAMQPVVVVEEVAE